MLEWIIRSFAILTLLIIAFAALVAVIIPDPGQRKDAYKVLRLAFNGMAGAGGVPALMVKLHDLGIL